MNARTAHADIAHDNGWNATPGYSNVVEYARNGVVVAVTYTGNGNVKNAVRVSDDSESHLTGAVKNKRNKVDAWLMRTDVAAVQADEPATVTALCGAEYAPGATFRCTLPTGHDNPLTHEDSKSDAPDVVYWVQALPWDTEALTNTDANGGNGTGDVLANRWDATVELNKATDACESSIVRDVHDAATARGLTGVERRTYVANYANNCQDNADEQYRSEIKRVRAATGYRSITPNDWRAGDADRVGLTHRAHMNNWEYVGVQTDYGKVFARANYRVAVTFIPGGHVAGAIRVNMDKLRSDSVEHTDNYNTIARWLDETPKHHGTGAQFDAESGRVATVTYTYERIASNTDNPTYTRETTFGYLTHNGARGVFRALLRSARSESATTLPTHVTIDETASGAPIKATVNGVTEGIRWRVTIENDRHYGTFVWDESSIGERRIVVPRKVERNRP